MIGSALKLASVPLGLSGRFVMAPEIGEVETRYADGHVMGGQRVDDAANRAQAAEQGYDGPDAVWRSLCEHELLHTLVARRLWGCESRVLRHECGAQAAPYALRLHEEAVVLSAQRWLNTGMADPVLAGDLVWQVGPLARSARRLVGYALSAGE